MGWLQFAGTVRRKAIETETLVVLLHDLGASATALKPLALRWAAAVPTTTFIALDDIAQLDDAPEYLRASEACRRASCSGSTVLNRAASNLEALLQMQLRSHGIAASRLVLAGFGYGGTLAVHLLLHQAWSCAGILAFEAQLVSPLPRFLRATCKVRMIDYSADGAGRRGSVRSKVKLLTERGIDTRGVVLSGSSVSNEAVRYGGAYLVELVATAQHSARAYVSPESRHA